jgi:hypothetical protein
MKREQLFDYLARPKMNQNSPIGAKCITEKRTEVVPCQFCTTTKQNHRVISTKQLYVTNEENSFDMELHVYLAFVVATAIMIAVPGPSVLFAVAYSIAFGCKHALATMWNPHSFYSSPRFF